MRNLAATTRFARTSYLSKRFTSYTSDISEILRLNIPPVHYGEKSTRDIYNIVEKDAFGKDVHFSQFKGKVLYGVNVDTFTRRDLYKAYDKYEHALLYRLSIFFKGKDVAIAVFPSNQFSDKEVTADEIVARCGRFGIKSDQVFVFDIRDVNGPEARPIYKFLVEKGVFDLDEYGGALPDFQGKFIVDKEGNAGPVESIRKIDFAIHQLSEGLMKAP